MAEVEAVPRPLTARQREVYEYVFAFACEYGYQPSYREVGAHFGLVHNAPYVTLRAIARRGWVDCGGPHKGSRSRAIRFLFKPDGTPFRGFEAR